MALSDTHVAESRKVGQRPGIDVRYPAGQACLPQRVKFEGVEALIVSPPSRMLSTEQREELDDRVARYRENPADVSPWELLSSDLRNKR